MSTRRAARSKVSIQAAAAPRAGVPDVLAAGPVVEYWATDRHNLIDAWVNYKKAVHQWLEEVGYDVRDRRSWPTVLQPGGKPYSLTQMRAEHPDWATQKLISRGLPADWAPPTTNRFIRGSQRGPQLRRSQ